MNGERIFSLLIPACLCLWPAWLPAEPDPAQLAWLDRQEIVMHWDNVEGAPVQLDGPEPRYSRRHGLHVLELQPGDVVRLRLASGEQLQILSADGRLGPTDIETAWSNGSGLYLDTPLHLSADATALRTLANPVSDGVIRITRPARHRDAISVALFTSRHARPARSTHYRDLISIPGLPPVRLTDRSTSETYWELHGDRTVTLPVPGATRLRLESRLVFPAAGDVFQQAYRITALLDGKPLRVLEFETTPDRYDPVAVDGCFSPAGRRLNGYLDIPAGAHQLELRSNAPLYLRLLGEQLPDDYLWNGNRPLHHAALQLDSTVPGSVWNQAEAQVLGAISSSARSLTASQQSVLRLLQDNGWRDGGLIGSALTRGWMLDYPGDNDVRQLSESAWSLHTAYRDLLPASQDVPVSQQFAWFRTPALRGEQRRVVIPETYAGSLSTVMAGGYFTELPAGMAGGYEYRLPERAAPSRLRLGVDRSSVSAATRIYLQFDDHPPRQLRAMNQPDLPAQEWQPGRAEAALTVMNHTHAARGLTLAGPFAARNSAAPLLDVALIEVPLPRETRRIRMWRAAEDGAPVRVALQYRASSYYQRAGTAYQSLLRELGPEAVYRQFLAALSGNTPGEGVELSADRIPIDGLPAGLHDAARDLRNQWLPLLRSLHSRQKRLAATLQASPATGQDPVPLGEPEIHDLQQIVQHAKESGDTVAELEAWTRIRHGSNGTLREQAALAQVQLLERTGELYLAEQQLRSHLLGSASDTFRRQVLERLLALYQRAGNDEGRLSVLATVVMHDPQPDYLRDLAAALLALGKTQYALQVLLALPPAERPRQMLLQASYTAGWWALFDKQLDGIKDRQEYHWWMGWRMQAAGDYGQAASDWAEVGTTAKALQRQLAEGLEIRTRLGSPDREQRRLAVLDWERWQSRYPGSREWQNEPQLVTRHAGAETIHISDQDQVLTAFRATPELPITLQVQGPVDLRLSLRPLHGAINGEAINDWVRLQDGTQQTPFPVTDNRVAYGLQLTGNGQAFPGLAETVEYRVAPGFHEIQVTPERGPLLLQVAAARPVQPLAVLPPLLPDTVRAALQGFLGDTPPGQQPDATAHSGIEVVRQCSVARLPVNPGLNALQPELAGVPVPTGAERTPDARQMTTPRATNIHVVRRDETLSDIALKYGQGTRQLARMNGIKPPYTIRVGQRLRLGKAAQEGGTSSNGHRGDAEVQAQMRTILWVAEHDDIQAVAMAAAGEALFQQHPQVPGLQEMLRRLHRATRWELVAAVQASAGIRVVEAPAGSPESPSMRIREALLPAPQPGEQLLSGYETLVFAVDQPAPSHFQIRLAMADLAPAQAQPLQVRLQVDNGPEQAVLQTPDTPQQSVEQRIPGGSHLLRVRIANPVLNQYLRVVIHEPGASTGSTLTSLSSRRNYHVATPDEPVVVYLEGPTRLRIDELRAGKTYYRNRNLAAGWQRLQLDAGPQQEQALFRIYRLTSTQPTVPVPARLPAWTPTAVPLPGAMLPADTERPQRAILDRFSFGGQEDGTWSLATSLVRRRNVDEEGSGDDEAEEFAELRAGHRYFSPDLHSYFRTDLLTRLRTEGGPTLGMREWIDIRRPDWPVDIALSGTLYTQRPDAETGSEWAATLRGSLSRELDITPRTTHRPALRMFQRWLSLDETPRLHPERVDQDLFTQYKHDHRHGLGLEDTLSYRPWLDTVWYGSLGVVSNEDFNVFDPDHASLALGARQLLKNWQASAEYQARHYFPDQDRNRHVTRHRYQLSLDWLGWRSDRHGWQGHMQLVWDDSSNDFSGLLSIAWLHSNARFWRDFRPAEQGFRSQRERQLQEQFFSTGTGDIDEQ